MENKDKLFSELFSKKDYQSATQIKLEELSDSPDIILRLAFCFFALHKPDESLAVLKKKQSVCTGNHYFHSLCGEIFLQQKKLQTAFRCFSQALKLNPPPSHRERINYFIAKIKEAAAKSSTDNEKQKPEAEKKAQEIEKLFTENNFSKVIEIGRIFLEENPLHISVMEKIGLACYQQKDFNSAQEIFEGLVQIEPHNHLHHYHLGISSIEEKDSKTAVISLKKSIMLNPIHQKSYYALAAVYDANGLGAEKQKLLQEIIIINPFTDIADKVGELLTSR
jgi:tetratricopeptide (TPR) repeat protein